MNNKFEKCLHPHQTSPLISVHAERKGEDKGRSMVETLGVLAIIGVLSAGALKGYSAAMFRHKINQTIDIYSSVLQKLSELDDKDWGTEDWVDSAEEIIEYGIFSEYQKTTDTGDAESGCRLPLGVLEIELTNYSGMEGILRLHLTDAKSCVAFASAGWENAIPVNWWRPGGYIVIEGNGSSYKIYEPADINNPVTKVNISKITKACNDACKNGHCSFTTVIREW